MSEIGAQSPDAAYDGSRPDLRHDLARPRLDPSSSSYEIEALTDDFDDDDGDRPQASADWDDDWDAAIEPDEEAVAPTARPSRLPGFLLRGPDRPAHPESAAAPPTIPAAWRVRLFEGWAVLFAVWAALIGARGVLATISREQEFLFSAAPLWPIASVILLVAASAGLFFVIDLSRRIAAPSSAGSATATPTPAPTPIATKAEPTPVPVLATAQRSGPISPARARTERLSAG